MEWYSLFLKIKYIGIVRRRRVTKRASIDLFVTVPSGPARAQPLGSTTEPRGDGKKKAQNRL
jgi:hypothetical protein